MLRIQKPCLNCLTPTHYDYCTLCVLDGATPEVEAKELTRLAFFEAPVSGDEVLAAHPPVEGHADFPLGELELIAPRVTSSSSQEEVVTGKKFPSDVYDYSRDAEPDLGDVVLSLMFAKPSPGVGGDTSISNAFGSQFAKTSSSGVPYFSK